MEFNDMTMQEYARQHGISKNFTAILWQKDLRADAVIGSTYNIGRLYEAKEPLFITSAVLEAVSIEEALNQDSGRAVAIGDSKHKLVNFLDAHASYNKDQKPPKTLILCFPSDDAGQKLQQEIAEELQAREITFICADISGDYKTINEALQNDKAKLKDDIDTACNIANLQPSNELKAYLKSSASDAIKDFTEGIKANADTPAISTGFNNLDKILEGGLYEGLYIIGAISSLGKTTYALQMIDQIAQSGQDCIIFSLEMAKTELMAKSISRQTFMQNRTKAKTTRGITSGGRYEGYSQEEKEIIQNALQNYSDYAKHIFIHEGVGDIGVRQIRETVKRHITLTGRKPVILIDYLQILAPYNDRFTDKQNTDRNIIELKRLSRDYKLPVIGISSFNRDNYTAPVNMTAFKESGAVEYSADVLMGLQYEGMEYQEGEKEQERLKRIRELFATNEQQAREGDGQSIQLKVLKNRNGIKGSAYYSFYAMFNCFKENFSQPAPGYDDADIYARLKSKAR